MTRLPHTVEQIFAQLCESRSHADGSRSSRKIDRTRVTLSSLPPLPRRHRLRINPQAYPLRSRFLLQLFQYRIPWRILPIPPAPALLDEFLIEIHPIGQHPAVER